MLVKKHLNKAQHFKTSTIHATPQNNLKTSIQTHFNAQHETKESNNTTMHNTLSRHKNSTPKIINVLPGVSKTLPGYHNSSGRFPITRTPTSNLGGPTLTLENIQTNLSVTLRTSMADAQTVQLPSKKLSDHFVLIDCSPLMTAK